MKEIRGWGNIFSEKEGENPGMYNYYKVFVHYCTSDLYAGRRDADEASGNYTFHGKYVVEAVVEDLLKVFSLFEVDIPQFVIMGASAGMVY